MTGLCCVKAHSSGFPAQVHRSDRPLTCSSLSPTVPYCPLLSPGSAELRPQRGPQALIGPVGLRSVADPRSNLHPRHLHERTAGDGKVRRRCGRRAHFWHRGSRGVQDPPDDYGLANRWQPLQCDGGLLPRADDEVISSGTAEGKGRCCYRLSWLSPLPRTRGSSGQSLQP
jgi:hypothetical protein